MVADERSGAAQLCVASMHYHDEIRICSGLITNAIIRNDEGRARRQQLRDLLNRLSWCFDPMLRWLYQVA